MAIVVMILAVIAWLFVQAALAAAGQGPRSRGSLRYQRRKAAKLGLDPADVEVRPRGAGPDSIEPVGRSVVGDLAFGLGFGLLAIVLMFGGAFVLMAMKFPPDAVWVWFGVVILATFVLNKIRRSG